MKKKMVGYLKMALGVILVVIGVIGTLLPVIPGVPLLLLGLLLLGVEIPALKKTKERVLERYRKWRRS